MKKIIIIAAVLISGIAAAFAYSVQMGPKALAVNDVGADPASYTGTITITGVTWGYSPTDPAVFGIADLKELQCTTPGCNKLMIPVRHQGQRPAPGDEVKVTGSFVGSGQEFMFQAKSVKVVRNHKIGG